MCFTRLVFGFCQREDIGVRDYKVVLILLKVLHEGEYRIIIYARIFTYVNIYIYI